MGSNYLLFRFYGRSTNYLFAFITALTACFPALAQSAKTSTLPLQENEMLVQEVVISGTTALDTVQLGDITNDLTTRRMRPDEDEVRERIQDAFQQRGYFDAKVTHLNVEPLDPLARPETVRIEANVEEGARFILGDIKFQGNHVFTAETLRQSLSIHKGEPFSTEKIRAGFGTLRKSYRALGYLDCSVAPKEGRGGEGVINMTLTVDEGPQYRMGTVQIYADKPELSDELHLRWKLQPGEPFDAFYVQSFLKDNSNLFPADFSDQNDVSIIRDCRDWTVTVAIQMDTKRAFRARPTDGGCPREKEPPKNTEKQAPLD